LEVPRREYLAVDKMDVDVSSIHTVPDSMLVVPTGMVAIAYLGNIMEVAVELETVAVGMVAATESYIAVAYMATVELGIIAE